jgi:hypothetical protein
VCDAQFELAALALCAMAAHGVRVAERAKGVSFTARTHTSHAEIAVPAVGSFAVPSARAVDATIFLAVGHERRLIGIRRDLERIEELVRLEHAADPEQFDVAHIAVVDESTESGHLILPKRACFCV